VNGELRKPLPYRYRNGIATLKDRAIADLRPLEQIQSGTAASGPMQTMLPAIFAWRCVTNDGGTCLSL